MHEKNIITFGQFFVDRILCRHWRHGCTKFQFVDVSYKFFLFFSYFTLLSIEILFTMFVFNGSPAKSLASTHIDYISAEILSSSNYGRMCGSGVCVPLPSSTTYKYAEKWVNACERSIIRCSHTMRRNEGKWSKKNVTAAHNILYSHNLSHIMLVPILLVLILCRHTPVQSTISGVWEGEIEKNVLRRNVRIFDLHHRCFILGEWLLLAHYVWIWYHVFVCLFLASYTLYAEKVDERAKRKKAV